MQVPKETFPRGLRQPEQGYRFSVDALLLSCYAAPRRGDRLLDLGTGCGVVALGALLNNPGLELQAVGIDADEEMLGYAGHNAAQLGLDADFTAFRLDVSRLRTSGRIQPESFDLVLANAPYRSMSQGRRPPDKGRTRSRFEMEAVFSQFAEAGAFALKNRSRMVLVHLAEKCLQVSDTLRQHRIEPKRLRFVHGREDSPARLILLEGVKNGRPGVQVESPLILYSKDRRVNRLHPQASAFCPFL